MKTKIISILPILLFSGLARAQADVARGVRHGGCIIDVSTLVGSSVSTISDCVIHEKPTIVEALASFPKLPGDQWHVRIWEGSYARVVEFTDIYTHSVYDRCQGVVLSTSREARKSTSEVLFGIENPNLNENVDASYQLAPMTDEEAKTAFEVAHGNCLAYSPTR